MSKTRPKSVDGKGLPTIVYVLILGAFFFCSIPAFATCQSSNNCNNETDANSTMQYDHSSNSTMLLDGFSNATLTADYSNMSFNQYSNSTLSFDQFSNSTLLLDQFSNATSMDGNDTGGYGDKQNDTTDENDTNDTSQYLMDSFQFASNDTDSTVTNEQDASNALHLQGDGYVSENSTMPSIQSLTVTAWVKPDYSQGSPVFTAVSDTNEFVLAVNNNMPVSKHAIFSIFDGIRWTTVQSTSQIPEQWTHLAATYNGTSIALYVNDSLENTVNVTGIPVLVDGELTTRTAQNLTSDANVTIGAYYDKTRENTKDLFSGEISDVNLYNITLTQAQIEKLFHNTKPNDNSTYSN